MEYMECSVNKIRNRDEANVKIEVQEIPKSDYFQYLW